MHNDQAKKGRLSASEISKHFKITAPALSQHLGVLAFRRQAQKRIDGINPKAIMEVEQWARSMMQLWEQRLDALEKALKVEKR
jgi:hypothetical protein